MQILTIDFETFYDRTFSLSKMTTEEYIRHEYFETIGVSVLVATDRLDWLTGFALCIAYVNLSNLKRGGV